MTDKEEREIRTNIRLDIMDASFKHVSQKLHEKAISEIDKIIEKRRQEWEQQRREE